MLRFSPVAIGLVVLFYLQITEAGCGAGGVNTQTNISWSGGTWQLYVWCPIGYGAATTTYYPALLFVPGLGEQGKPPSALLKYGPNAATSLVYHHEYNINGVVEKLIAISIMPPASYPSATAMEGVVVALLAAYRIDTTRVYITGLSAGAQVWNSYVLASNTYAKRVAAAILLSAQDVSPKQGWGNFVLGGGKYWGFCGRSDGTCQPHQWEDAQMCDMFVYGSSRFSSVFEATPHSNWTAYYDPRVFVDYDQENIYTFMLKQKRVTVPDANGFCPPGYYMKCGTACSVVPNCHGGSVSCSGTQAVCDSCPHPFFKLCNGACTAKPQCFGGTVTCDAAPSVNAKCVCPAGTTLCTGACQPTSPTYCRGGASKCDYFTNSRACTSCTAANLLCKGKCAVRPTNCTAHVCQDSLTAVCGTCPTGQFLCGGTCKTPPTCNRGWLTCTAGNLVCNCFDTDVLCAGTCSTPKECRYGQVVCLSGYQQCTGCVNGDASCQTTCVETQKCGGTKLPQCGGYGSWTGGQTCLPISGCGVNYTSCNVNECSPTPNCRGGIVRCAGAYAVCASCGAGYTLCGGVCISGTSCTGASPCLASQTLCSGVCADNVPCTGGTVTCAGGLTSCKCTTAGQSPCGGVCSTPVTGCAKATVCVGTTWQCAL